MVKRGYGRYIAPAVLAGMSMFGRKRQRIIPSASRGARSLFSARARRKRRLQTRVRVKLDQGVKQLGTGGSFSSFFYGRRFATRFQKNLFKNVSCDYYQNNGFQRMTATVGRQNHFAISWFLPADMKSICSQVTGQNKIMFRSMSGELLLTNQDLGNVSVKLYDIMVKRDIHDTTVADPDQAWTNGYLNSGSTMNDANVGCTPFSANRFTQYFTVKKITHLILAQGQSHTHRISFQPNRSMSEETLNDIDYCVKGFTCFTMVVYHGMPYNDSLTKSQVSTGSCALDCVYKRQYKYQRIEDSISSTVGNNILAIAFTNNENVMDIGTGAIEIGTQA